MRLDIGKIDERIQKLQEIKRIAADPEMVEILLEFVIAENDGLSGLSPAKIERGARSRNTDEASDLVADVLSGVEPQTGIRRGRSLLD